MHFGRTPAGMPVEISEEARRLTHEHFIGGSGLGKSKAMEQEGRGDIFDGRGCAFVDRHGVSVSSLIRWCAWHRVGLDGDTRRLILLNFSEPEWVTGLSFFLARGGDVATQVSRRIEATLKAWGTRNADLMPTFERVCRLIYTFAVETGEPLPCVAHLLDFENAALRLAAIEHISDSRLRAQWRQLQQIKTLRDWNDQVLSTDNRLTRFLASRTIRRFLGLTEQPLDLLECMNRGDIILVNLAESPYLSSDQARVLGALFLNEFFEAALRRAVLFDSVRQQPPLYKLYLDEFQDYITDDLSSMLDQVRKGGLHLVLAHQHFGHFAESPLLLKSVLTNARIRAVFGGLSYEDACLVANETMLDDINRRQVKKAYYHTVHRYEEETRNVRSRSHGHSFAAGRTLAASEAVTDSTGHVRARGNVRSHLAAFGSSFGTSSGRNFGTSSSEFSSGSFSGLELSGESHGEFEGGNLGEFAGSSSSEAFGEAATESEADVTGHAETSGTSRAKSLTRGRTDGSSETILPVWVPIAETELASEAEWSREEKLSQVAERLKALPQRHCLLKIGPNRAQIVAVEPVRDPAITEAEVHEYIEEIYRAQRATRAEEADRLIAAAEARFLSRYGKGRRWTSSDQAGPGDPFDGPVGKE